MMSSKIILDLKEVGCPLDLLKCKACIKSMEKGEVLEVIISDKRVEKDLTTIINRSGDRLIYRTCDRGGICLGIKKGSRPFDTRQSDRKRP